MQQELSIRSRLLLLSGLLMLGLIGTTLHLPSTMSANAKLVSQTTGFDQQIRAANEVRNSFGEERVAEVLAASADDTLLSRLVAGVRQFDNGLPPSDDVAALHLRHDVS